MRAIRLPSGALMTSPTLFLFLCSILLPLLRVDPLGDVLRSLWHLPAENTASA